MMQDGEITRERALELAHMALHDNAAKLYGWSNLKVWNYLQRNMFLTFGDAQFLACMRLSAPFRRMNAR